MSKDVLVGCDDKKIAVAFAFAAEKRPPSGRVGRVIISGASGLLEVETYDNAMLVMAGATAAL